MKISNLVDLLKQPVLTYEEREQIKEKVSYEISKGLRLPSWSIGGSDYVTQLYCSREFLYSRVSEWVKGAFAMSGGSMIVCYKENKAAIIDILKRKIADFSEHEESGRILFVDAENLVADFMNGDKFNEKVFLEIVESLSRKVRRACGNENAPVNVYGSILGEFFRQGKVEASAELRTAWKKTAKLNKMRFMTGYNLDMCSYEALKSLPNILPEDSMLLPIENAVKFDEALRNEVKKSLGISKSHEFWREACINPPISAKLPLSNAALLGLSFKNPDLTKDILTRICVSNNLTCPIY